MRYLFIRCDTLPRLGWCAHLSHGSRIVRVYHGPWVETRDDWFVEGAWTGDFEKGDLDAALFLVGSGGVIRDGRALFCTQTDMIERLYSIRVGRDLFLSNSMVFALAMADDEPDPRYPFYAYKLQWYALDGPRRKYKVLPTRRGRRLQLHEYCGIAVGDDLTLTRVDKPLFPEPADFHDYRSMLRDVLSAVLANAASPGRHHRRYDPLAMVSGGFDSNAVAAMLRELGVREAVTVYDGQPGIDSGEEVARFLGMTTHVHGRTDFRSAGVDEKEFLASWPGAVSDIVLGVFEPQMSGRLLTTGRNGDVVFGQDPALMIGDFRTPVPGAGSRLLEFRLRLGFLHFSPLYTAGLHLSAMSAITTSWEMAPWRLGGDYDRPIARRILEEAGVPRGAFGVTKRKSAFHVFRSHLELSPVGRADFESYRRSMPSPGVFPYALLRLRAVRDRTIWVLKRVWWRAGKAADSLIPSCSWFRQWSEMDFAFHWGHFRSRPRYAEAVTARSTHARIAGGAALSRD
jgi:hypothetical protein